MTVRYRIRDGVVETIHKVKIFCYRALMDDINDPQELFFDQLRKWQDSERGQFLITRTLSEPEIIQSPFLMLEYGYKFYVTVELLEKHLSEYYLKWGNPDDESF